MWAERARHLATCAPFYKDSFEKRFIVIEVDETTGLPTKEICDAMREDLKCVCTLEPYLNPPFVAPYIHLPYLECARLCGPYWCHRSDEFATILIPAFNAAMDDFCSADKTVDKFAVAPSPFVPYMQPREGAPPHPSPVRAVDGETGVGDEEAEVEGGQRLVSDDEEPPDEAPAGRKKRGAVEVEMGARVAAGVPARARLAAGVRTGENARSGKRAKKEAEKLKPLKDKPKPPLPPPPANRAEKDLTAANATILALRAEVVSLRAANAKLQEGAAQVVLDFVQKETDKAKEVRKLEIDLAEAKAKVLCGRRTELLMAHMVPGLLASMAGVPGPAPGLILDLQLQEKQALLEPQPQLHLVPSSRELLGIIYGLPLCFGVCSCMY